MFERLTRLPLVAGRHDASVALDDGTDLDFQRVVEQAEVGLCITQDDCFVYVNPKFAELNGYTPTEMLGMHYTRVVHLDERERVAEIRRQRNSGQHRIPYDTVSVRSDGTTFVSRAYGRAIQYRGKLANLVTLSDMSDLAQATRQSAWRARVLTSTELLSRSGSFELMPRSRTMRLSAGAQALLGEKIGGREVPFEYLTDRIPECDRQRVRALWRAARPSQPFEIQHRLQTIDGRWLDVLHRGLIEVDSDGKRRPVAILQDVTEHLHAQAEVERLQNRDPVTGLPTRNLMLQRLTVAFDTARVENLPLAVLHLRVPDMDRVHDALGLGAGEQLANALADRVIQNCRAEDVIASLGNGEFGVLLDPVAGADEEQARQTALRILAALEAPTRLDSTEVFTGGRIGIAWLPGSADSAFELMEQAYAACSRDETGISVYTGATGAQAARRMRLESALRRAFQRQQFSVHYQPQIDLRQGTLVGAEALLRWHSEEFGEVPPTEFVPIAEEMGLIIQLGEWVFRTACEQSVKWANAGLPRVRLGVNLSPRQLEQHDISQRLQSIILETGADPGRLGIEVTESVLMRDLEGARRTLTELSALGMEIALDDFGTGYSNMGVLRALPFDVLKIDRSLVHDVTAAPEDVSITRAVLMLAQGLKLKVLAEGVETEGQLNLLISNGCDLMQGFIFSRPLEPAAMEQLLQEGRRLPEQYLGRTARQRTLLLVDDEENVLSSLRRLLRSEGYRIVIARSGAEGLAKLAEQEVDVIISDQRMPGMTGVEFLRRAKELYPETVRIVLSGYTELQTITDAVNEGAIYKFLTKPWDDERLRAHVAEAFRRKELSDENRRLTTEVRDANLELAQANARQQALLARQNEQLDIESVRAVNAQHMLEDLPVAMIGLDTDGTVVFVNAQARSLMGAQQPLVGLPAQESLPAEWWQAADPSWPGAAAAGVSAAGVHRRVSLGGRRYVLSRAAMSGAGGSRGELLSLLPDLESPSGV